MIDFKAFSDEFVKIAQVPSFGKLTGLAAGIGAGTGGLVGAVYSPEDRLGGAIRGAALMGLGTGLAGGAAAGVHKLRMDQIAKQLRRGDPKMLEGARRAGLTPEAYARGLQRASEGTMGVTYPVAAGLGTLPASLHMRKQYMERQKKGKKKET